MDNDRVQGNMPINDIGSVARKLDIEMTVLERMKIRKSTLLRMLGATFVYLTMMSLFFLFL